MGGDGAGRSLGWLLVHGVLAAVALGFLLRAAETQVYFEGTDEAVTQAYAHHPELSASLAALVVALAGGVVQWRLSSPRLPARAGCLVVTAAVVVAALSVGAVATRQRLPSRGAIAAVVSTVPAVTGAVPLPPDALDSESLPGYPTVERTWQLGPSFARSDVTAESRAITSACSALRAAAPASAGWRVAFAQATFCDEVRTVGNVRLHYSATLTPGRFVPGSPQPETVVIRLVGTIASPTNG